MAKNSAAKTIGKGLAYVQDTLDIAVSWGFNKMKKLKVKEDDKSQAASLFKKGLNKSFHFVGELGESFYDEYEKLKQDRKP